MSVGRPRSVTQDHFVEPVENNDNDEVLEDKSSRYSKRRANLYDAVAGMLSRLILSLGRQLIKISRSCQPSRNPSIPAGSLLSPRYSFIGRSTTPAGGTSPPQTEYFSRTR